MSVTFDTDVLIVGAGPVGMTLATSTLSSIIPPSILMVIAGSIANQSIGLLLIAGLGLLTAAITVGVRMGTRWR